MFVLLPTKLRKIWEFQRGLRIFAYLLLCFILFKGMSSAENQGFLASDSEFLRRLSWVLLIIGFLGGICNLFYLILPLPWLYFFQLNVWGSGDTHDAAISNLNLNLAIIALGFSLSLRSRLSWYIAQILLILLLLLFTILTLLFISTFLNLKISATDNTTHLAPIIEAILTNLCFSIFCMSLCWYLFLIKNKYER